MRWVLRLSSLVLLLAVIVAGVAYWGLRGSLPQLEGELQSPDVSANVIIERDQAGIPRIIAENRQDLAYATGFVHAQERFFRMDLQRRLPAGELAELVGRAALDWDLEHRVHQFRRRAERALAELPTEHKLLLEAYTRGVNHGLAKLDSKPFEYHLLRQAPEPWQSADSLLTILAMYLDLQESDGFTERLHGAMHQQLPEDIASYFTAASPSWEAPVAGSAKPLVALPSSPLPLLGHNTPVDDAKELESDDMMPGSNNWAVSGELTPHGSAIVADDMHLSLGMPPIWYRASLVLPQGSVSGVTLPGTPAVVAGSNGAIAWGFTNSNADYSDVINLQTRQHPQTGDDEYLTPDGWKPFSYSEEKIRISGEDYPNTLIIKHTQWGPVINDFPLQALRWVAHDTAGLNLELLKLERATSAEQALQIAPGAGIPGQNLVVGDREGHIGWTIMGRLPKRFGFDGRLPSDWSDGSRGWDGYLDPADYPRVLDPKDHRLWTANARVLSDERLALLGEGGYSLGARAAQIRDNLQALNYFNEQSMLSIQLDNRALFLARWHQLALELEPENTAVAKEIEQSLQSWSGRASIDSSGYYLVRTFRLQVLEQITAPLRAAMADQFGSLSAKDINRQLEDAAWQLIQLKPEHMLPTRYASWRELLDEALLTSWRKITRNDQLALAEQTWGTRNTSQVRHPLSNSLGPLARWLDMPAEQLPGDSHMPRVQGRSFGASERMVVAPGQEDQGILHMPGGQSGHPLSPYYGAGHQDWANGQPSPFLPGATQWQLTLRPAG